ncbi:MAG: MFS transporter [Rikenellaceae bacterium]|nr:MFS transporter [Rikenellaceae bacterium]MCL2693310.1 MFS transporter [Rikenellaceae bacterium]
MMSVLQKNISDSPVARWSALILLSLLMFFAYMFFDVLSPLENLLATERGWTPGVFGTVGGSSYMLNVFGFLIIAGIILDKMGVRFTGLLAASIMVVGGAVKLYGISDAFSAGGFGYDFMSSFWTSFPPSAKMALLGFAIFGCGAEMAGITVSRAIVKWFAGKELAMAMGLEMAIARLGVFAIFRLSPAIADSFGSVVMPVAICGLLLCVGLLSFSVYALMDRKLDRQLSMAHNGSSEEDKFRVSDIGRLFTSRVFMIVALLCVLYYSSIFPFQRFATGMIQTRLAIDATSAAKIFSLFPIGAMALTPFIGAFIDFRGRAATMLIFGAALMCICHLIFAYATLTTSLTYITILLLGISFALVPAALWPSVPKIVESRYMGSAYALIFWIQNVGLFLVPSLFGWSLQKSNPGVAEQIQAGVTGVSYDYTYPLLIFAGFGVLAFMLGIWLKALNKKNNYGLEAPNVKK